MKLWMAAAACALGVEGVDEEPPPAACKLCAMVLVKAWLVALKLVEAGTCEVVGFFDPHWLNCCLAADKLPLCKAWPN